MWDVYDRTGQRTGRVKQDRDDYQDGEYLLGVAAWIMNSKHELFILKRAATKRVRPLCWCVPGGSAELGESNLDACARETYEETGIRLDKTAFMFLDRLWGGRNVIDSFVIFADFEAGSAVLPPEEVSEATWASFESVASLYDQGLFMVDRWEEVERVRRFAQDQGWR